MVSNETRKSLTPDDWSKAGFRALANGGPGAIRIEALARDIGVTKGSFYWHFKDLNALKHAMLDLWRRAATEDVIRETQRALSPKEQLIALAHAAATEPDQSYGGRFAEAAIRDWGRYDSDVSTCIAAVDAERIAYVTTLFVELAFSVEDARRRAVLMYAAYVGMVHLDLPEEAAPPVDLIGFTTMLMDNR